MGDHLAPPGSPQHIPVNRPAHRNDQCQPGRPRHPGRQHLEQPQPLSNHDHKQGQPKEDAQERQHLPGETCVLALRLKVALALPSAGISPGRPLPGTPLNSRLPARERVARRDRISRLFDCPAQLSQVDLVEVEAHHRLFCRQQHIHFLDAWQLFQRLPHVVRALGAVHALHGDFHFFNHRSSSSSGILKVSIISFFSTPLHPTLVKSDCIWVNLSLGKKSHTGYTWRICQGENCMTDNGYFKQTPEERLSKLSVVVEQTPASVVVTDTQGKIEYVNPAFERVTGYTLEEVIGKNPSILKSGITPVELYQSMWQTISNGEVWSGEICNRKKNGEFFWELGTVSPIRNKDGIITNFISVKEDISERKKNEDELQRYRQQLEELVEARNLELREEIDEHKRTELLLREKEQSLDLALRIGKLGGWEYDFQTSNITWADEVYRIFGVDPSDTRLNYQKVLGLVHPEDQAFVQQTLDTAIASHQPFNIDHRIISFDGQQRVINLSGVPAHNNLLGVSTKMIGTVQDITERVLLRTELLEKERMSRELAIGRDIQLSMLPKASPSVVGWQFAVFYQPAREVGGDFYDWINLPKGKIGIIIADVSDKGVPAALSMALCRAILRTNALISNSPKATLVRSNEILFHDYYNGGYVSVICASLDQKMGT